MLGLGTSTPPQGAFKAHNRIAGVGDLVGHQLESYGDRPAIRMDVGDRYATVSFSDYRRRVLSMVGYFQRAGAVQKVVATLCKNRLEWDMTALAAFHTANILFPLDTKFNDAEFEHLMRLSPPDYALVSRAQLPRFRELRGRLGLATVVLVADLVEVFEDLGVGPLALGPGEVSVEGICRGGREGDAAAHPLLLESGTILGHYATSGTVSLPKIVRISHGNIVAEVNCAMDVINLRPNEDVLNIGPYTHIATLVEFLVSKTRGYTVTYFTREPDDDDVLEDEIAKLKRQDVRVKVLMAVPKFWIYLVKEVLEEMKNKPVMRRLYRHLTAIEKNESIQDLGTLEMAKLTAMRILLRNKLGGYFSYGISSSTKLDGALVRILGKLGITVIDIYGATECCGIISRNRLDDVQPGSCGKLIPELAYEVSGPRQVAGLDQEIGVLRVKGPTVAPYTITADGGQVPLPDAADGFYTTGDLCWVGPDRQVHLVGRERELVAWEDGSLIDPQHVSNLLVRSIFVKDAMVARRDPGDPFLSVYIYPDWKRLEKDPDYRGEIAAGVSPAAALKSRCVEAIRYAESVAPMSAELAKDRIYLLPRKLERTPTHKIKFVFELAHLDQAREL